MVKRVSIDKRPKMDYVRYLAYFDSGVQECSCDMNDWNRYVLMVKLIDQGADEKDLNELFSIGYSEGSNDAAIDAADADY